MVHFEYIAKGLRGLSNAHRAGSMAGHLGSAVLAGYLFGEERPDLEAGVYLGIERDLERIMAGEETVWFNPEKVGVTPAGLFEHGSADEADLHPDPMKPIAEAISSSVGPLRQSGHNVIFASIALRIFRDHPELAERGIVNGVSKLMSAFANQGQGRGYYGEKAGWKQGGAVDIAGIEAIECSSPSDAARIAMEELIATIPNNRKGFGGMFHLIDHAAALIDLERCGFADLAQKGISGFQRHVALLRSLPIIDEEEGPLRASELDPIDPRYWSKRDSSQYSAWLTHRIKVLYGYAVISAEAGDEIPADDARTAFRYLMA